MDPNDVPTAMKLFGLFADEKDMVHRDELLVVCCQRILQT